MNRIQQTLNNPKIPLQELRPNMLKHAYRNHPIIFLLPTPRRRRRPIITQQNPHLPVLLQSRLSHPLRCQIPLLLRQRHTRHLATRRLRSGDGDIAPSAPDVEEVMRGIELGLAEEVADFALLGCFQRFGGVGPVRTGVVQVWGEEGGEEGVGGVVV